MALQKSIETSSGIVCAEAYIVVEALNYTKNNVSSYLVRVYKDKAARDDAKQPILVIQDQIELDLMNEFTWMEQVYNILKLQDLFAGAEDV
jgi:hypothetical protein